MPPASNGARSAASTHPAREQPLAGVAIRAFGLGVVGGLALLGTILLACSQSHLWRATYFLAALSTFHFLEFYLTAAYNAPAVTIEAFLLSQNGKAYNVANAAAMCECLATSLLAPGWRMRTSSRPLLLAGFAATLIGQAIRSLAMAQAGTNFNHTMQTRKNQGHQLVKHGVYAHLRHPAYFGFYWWALGTQAAMGNFVCFAAYAVILWIFFQHRIQKEEQFLFAFFGDEYTLYRTQTRVGIPFIR